MILYVVTGGVAGYGSAAQDGGAVVNILWLLLQAVLLGMGLQHKTVEQLEGELELPAAQLLGLFNKVVRKLAAALTAVLEREVEQDMVARREVDLTPATQSVDQDLVGAN